MPVVKCPYFDDCGFQTEDTDTALAVVFLNIHNNQIHAPRNNNNNNNIANNNDNPPRRQVPKIDRPKVSRGSSEETWISFNKRWTLFKTGTGLSNDEKVHQLFECCDQDLGEAILKSSSTAVTGTEENLLAVMKQLAVIPVAISIRRTDLLSCHQDHGEAGRAYHSRLMGKAAVCAYSMPCSSDTCNTVNDFTDIIVKDVMVNGLVDEEIKRDVLGWAELDVKNVNETVRYVEAKEMARDALNQKPPTNAAISTYKKSKSSNSEPTPKLKVQCKECKVEIDKFVWNRRLKKTIECTSCLPCWQKANPRAPKQKPQDETSSMALNTSSDALPHDETWSILVGAIADSINPKSDIHCEGEDSKNIQSLINELQNLTNTLNNMKDTLGNIQFPARSIEEMEENVATVTSNHITSEKREIVLDHHIFRSHEGWKRAESMSHPTLRLRLTTEKDDYKVFGGSCPDISPSWVTAVTDTGAQSCLWSLQDFYRCGFKDSDLIPVRRTMVAANSEAIDIVGAVFIRLSGTNDNTGETYTAAVMAYVSPNTKKLYLPREALIQLKVISKDFPKVGAVSEIAPLESNAKCGCLLRTLPPEKLVKLPFRACPENVSKMKDWLWNRYAGSTFNTCRHQQLRGMSGPPLELHIDESVPHKPARTPAMVPIHDQEQIKAQLDEDVALGVIEPVPYGQVPKYCHRMVITRKADGTPRRTIDMSSLNKATIRETHHVRPPFQQARSMKRFLTILLILSVNLTNSMTNLMI